MKAYMYCKYMNVYLCCPPYSPAIFHFLLQLFPLRHLIVQLVLPGLQHPQLLLQLPLSPVPLQLTQLALLLTCVVHSGPVQGEKDRCANSKSAVEQNNYGEGRRELLSNHHMYMHTQIHIHTYIYVCIYNHTHVLYTHRYNHQHVLKHTLTHSHMHTYTP